MGARIATIAIVLGWAASAHTDVIVLANRTTRDIPVRIVHGDSRIEILRIPRRDVLPIETNGRFEIEYTAIGTTKRRHRLDANAAYYFANLRSGQIGLRKIGLGGNEATARGRRFDRQGSRLARISVKVLVDDEEPSRDRIWQKRLAERIEAASQVLSRYCRVQLDIVAFGTWQSDNTRSEFAETFSEFEKEVDPFPAQLAIGFSSQYQLPHGRTHLGGTRGPLREHILIREWSRHVNEQQRLEILVHELGHYLGAAHSPEPDSIMRPVIGGRGDRGGIGIRFDAVNTLTTFLVAEEMRHRGVTRFADLSSPTKQRLGQVYGELIRANPKDTSAKRFAQLVRVRRRGALTDESAREQKLIVATREVLTAMVIELERNARLPRSSLPEQDPSTGEAEVGYRKSGDQLTEHCVRVAAEAASGLETPDVAAAFLLAVGIGLDDSTTLRKHPKTAQFVASVEDADARLHRLEVLGSPTMAGRRDLAKHFFVSSYLGAVLGRQAAQNAGEAKELLDAATKSGFSFVDLAADRAGIAFARSVLARKVSLQTIHKSFAVDDYLPPLDGMAEGIGFSDFRSQYGSKADPRYVAALQEIDCRIEELPPYQQPTVANR